jgi:uncharacterized protein (TIGR03083 family)
VTTSTGPAAREIPRPPLRVAQAVARAELETCLGALRQLDDTDWHRPTGCTGWTVHDVVAHMVGQVEELARPDRLVRRVRRARREPGGSILDKHNRYQVEERAAVPAGELVMQLETHTVRAIRAVGRMPGPVRRRIRLSRLFPEAANFPEDTFDYLARVILARDPWMHRLDICAATGRAPQLGDNDHLIVEQVIRDLAEAWSGPSVEVDLTGPAGGRWTLGDRTPVAAVRADVVPYLRHLSGRSPGGDVTVDGDTAAGKALLAARVEF